MGQKYLITPGEKYGQYTVVKREQIVTPAGTSEWRWECIGDDGKTYHMRSRALYMKLSAEENSEKAKEINQIVENLEKEHKNQMGLRRLLYQQYISNAIKRCIPFNLTFDQFNDLISQDCHYCGSEPEIKTSLLKRADMNQPPLKANGIDRIDSSKFYDLDNCVPCCSKCNMMKNNSELSDFLDHITKIYKHQESLKESSTTIETTSDNDGKE